MSLFGIRNNPIGSLFTRGGMSPGQTIGRAYADFGRTIGATALDAKHDFKGDQMKGKSNFCHKKLEQTLEQYSNDPRGLLIIGQEKLTKNNPQEREMGQRFIQIAQARITQQTADTEKETTELQRQGELRLMDLARMNMPKTKDIMNNDLQRRAYLNVAAGFKVSPARAMEIARTLRGRT